jgi:hypothetical protein
MSKQQALSLMYHDVIVAGDADASGFAGSAAAKYKLGPDDFRAHLEQIRKAIEPRSVDVIDRFAGWGTRRPLFLTFDDGGCSAYDCIAQMLEAHGWLGHFFVTTDYLDTKGFLTRGQVRMLRRRGHVIGNHSCSHPTRMGICSSERIVREWSVGRETLSDILGEPVTVASVPGGWYSPRVAYAAALAGVETLFTSEPTTDVRVVHGCRVVGRYAVRRRMRPSVSAAFASGRLTPRVKQAVWWNVKKGLKISRFALRSAFGDNDRGD